jgi:hypothetical protein
MEEVKKEIKKYEITEEEINVLLQFIGTKPLAEALQPFGILQGVLQKEIKPNNDSNGEKCVNNICIRFHGDNR